MYVREQKKERRFASALRDWRLRYLFLKDLAENQRQNKPEIYANSLIYKHLTANSLFLKDLASIER